MTNRNTDLIIRRYFTTIINTLRFREIQFAHFLDKNSMVFFMPYSRKNNLDKLLRSINGDEGLTWKASGRIVINDRVQVIIARDKTFDIEIEINMLLHHILNTFKIGIL